MELHYVDIPEEDQQFITVVQLTNDPKPIHTHQDMSLVLNGILRWPEQIKPKSKRAIEFTPSVITSKKVDRDSRSQSQS